MHKSAWCLIGLLTTNAAAAAEPVQFPKFVDERYRLELVAAEPEIVTPVAIAFDAKGRLLVIESHTHFRPPNYQGPKADRIRILEEPTRDGKPARFSTFFE